MTFAIELVFILVAALIGGFIAQKIRVPVVVGYLCSGVIFSWLLGSRINLVDINSIADLGVALLMFTLGLEFSYQKIIQSGKIIILGGVSLFILMSTGLFLLLTLFGLDTYTALFLGLVTSLSSTAVAVKVLFETGELESLTGEIAVGILLVQDFISIPLFILLPLIGSLWLSGGGGLWHILLLSRGLSISLVTLIVIFVIGRKTIPWILDQIANTRNRELLLTAVVAICFLSAAIFAFFGLSFALGAFIAGVLLSSSSASHEIFAEVRPLRDVFSIVFFVSLGFLLPMDFLVQNLGVIVIITSIIVILKFLITLVWVLFFGYHSKTAFGVAAAMISVGEFAFILGRVGLEGHLISQWSYTMLLSIALISLVVSSPILTNAGFIYRNIRAFFVHYLPKTQSFWDVYDKGRENVRVYKDHAIVLGHGRVGRYISHALSQSSIPYVVIDYNNHLVNHLRKRGVDVVYGDPVEIDILRSAGIGSAKVLIVAIPDIHTAEIIIANSKNLNPNIKIISRIHHEGDIARLKDLGVTFIIQPEFEAAISMTQKILLLFNLKMPEIYERVVSLSVEHES